MLFAVEESGAAHYVLVELDGSITCRLCIAEDAISTERALILSDRFAA